MDVYDLIQILSAANVYDKVFAIINGKHSNISFVRTDNGYVEIYIEERKEKQTNGSI